MTGRLLELAPVALVVWAVRAFFWPFAKCRRCQGTGRNLGSTSRRFGMCPRCGGSGRRQVLGSKSVHKAFLAWKQGWK